jgi:hypothetical protein
MNANNPANSVPNPLLSPLHKVAPAAKKTQSLKNKCLQVQTHATRTFFFFFEGRKEDMQLGHEHTLIRFLLSQYTHLR